MTRNSRTANNAPKVDKRSKAYRLTVRREQAKKNNEAYAQKKLVKEQQETIKRLQQKLANEMKRLNEIKKLII